MSATAISKLLLPVVRWSAPAGAVAFAGARGSDDDTNAQYRSPTLHREIIGSPMEPGRP